MASVTARIKEIKQPNGGYLSPSSFDVKELKDKKVLNENENISPATIGLVVDYITRFLISADLRSAFKISISGARIAQEETGKNTLEEIEDYLCHIHSFDDKSIIYACKATMFDVWCRNPKGATLPNSDTFVEPDEDTIANIKTLINRSLDFWDKYGDRGGYKADGFTFGEGYTETVNCGDGDYLTKDTIWDFKVSKNEPTAEHTLQLLMYYIMGKHSGLPEFKGIKKIGIFNPRLNKVYLYEIKKLPKEIIKTIEDDVICY